MFSHNTLRKKKFLDLFRGTGALNLILEYDKEGGFIIPYYKASRQILTHDDFRQLFEHLEYYFSRVEPIDITYYNLSTILSRTEPKNQPGQIYLLKCNTRGFYKIGFTTHTPEERLKQIAAAEHFPLENYELLHSFFSIDARYTELMLHAKYWMVRKEGEWFALRDYEVDEICQMGPRNNLQDLLEDKPF